MKTILFLGLTLIAVGGFALPADLSAQIINIDFIGTRTDSATPEQTPHGANGYASAFPGGGTVYNNIVANDTADTDNITVAGTDLLDSNGGSTLENFTISPVGADNNGVGVFNGSDLFSNSANNASTAVPFTISGLGAATSLDVIFLTSGGFVPAVTFDGSPTDATPVVINGYTYEYDSIPVVAGSVTGTIGPADTSKPLILSGLAFSSQVPEPSTYAMLLAGLGLLVGIRRIRKLA